MKQLLLPFICTFGLLTTDTSSLFAQNGNNISVNVSATVTPSSIELITIQSMNLSGEEAENDIITIDPLTSGNAGKMLAIGNPNTDFSISFLKNRELVRSGGNETLSFNYVITGNTIDDQSTAEILDQENRELEFNSEGEFYLWIGGNIDISTAEPGNYQGEFTLEIEYI